MIPPLAQALDQIASEVLEPMIRKAGAVVPSSRKEQAALWERLVGNPARIQAALNALSKEEAQALNVLQKRGGELSTKWFCNLLQVANLVPADNHNYSSVIWFDPKQHRPIRFWSLLRALMTAGLVLTHTKHPHQRSNSLLDFSAGLYVYIPDEVQCHLPQKERFVDPQRIKTELFGSARILQRDLYLLWSQVSEAPLTITNFGAMHAGDLKRIAGKLLVPETYKKGAREFQFRRLFFLRRLLVARQLLSDHSSTVVATSATTFFSESAIERVKQCYDDWRSGRWWNELWATTQDFGADTKSVIAPAPAEVATARQTVLDQLAIAFEPNPSAWLDIDTFIGTMQLQHNEFLLKNVASRYYYRDEEGSTGRYQNNTLGWGWYIKDDDRDLGWTKVETPFIKAILHEGLYWLGLVDLGYDAEVTANGGTAPASMCAVRLTDMGRWLLLGKAPPVVAEESGRVVVQPNFHIFAFDPISDQVLARLDSFAGRVNVGRAVEYVISRESLYAAQQAGQTAAEVQGWLEQVTGAPLPQNVARSLAEWQGSFEQITLYSRTVWIETATAELADALLSLKALKGAGLRRVTSTGLLAPVDKVDSIEQALHAAGEAPIRSREAANAHHNSVIVQADGQIVFSGNSTNFYTLSRLREFGEEVAGGWRITRASIVRAQQNGIHSASILARLQEMAVQEIPAAFQQQLKVWANHYGAATVQTVTLVQVRDEAVLRDLLDDPELAALLRPWSGADKPATLALASPDAVERLTQRLEALGVDVRAA